MIARNRQFLTEEEEERYRQSPRLVTPSKISVWEADYAPGARYSRRQLLAMRDMGLDPESHEMLQVIVVSDWRRLYVGSLEKQPLRRVPCPVIGRQGDRLKVIAPNGYAKLVYPNGSLRAAPLKPDRRPAPHQALRDTTPDAPAIATAVPQSKKDNT